jgi:hypothetical protein
MADASESKDPYSGTNAGFTVYWVTTASRAPRARKMKAHRFNGG